MDATPHINFDFRELDPRLQPSSGEPSGTGEFSHDAPADTDRTTARFPCTFIAGAYDLGGAHVRTQPRDSCWSAAG